MRNAKIEVRTPYPVEALRQGARRLSKNSANRLSQPSVARKLETLRRLVQSERQCKLKLGDALVEMIDRFELRPVDLARELKERANHLSEMYHVARLFPPNVRQAHVPYTHYWATMRTVRRFRSLQLNPVETLREIASLGLTQHRQITAHFAAKLRKVEGATALQKCRSVAAVAWSNRCYHDDCRTVMRQIPDGSIKILHIDPPYANYRRTEDGRYSAGSMTSTDCDNEESVDAIKLANDLLEISASKLTPGGVMLLWQSAGPIRSEIDVAMHRHGWVCEAVAIWDKGAPQPGNFETPYSTQTEWLWVLKRAGDKLINHDNSRRGDILRFQPVHRLAELHRRLHAFEKPADLCRFLIGKHSYAGETVVDLCACTGTMAAAAAELGRRWVYVESHDVNFQIGYERLMARSPRLAV